MFLTRYKYDTAMRSRKARKRYSTAAPAGELEQCTWNWPPIKTFGGDTFGINSRCYVLIPPQLAAGVVQIARLPVSFFQQAFHALDDVWWLGDDFAG